MDKQKKRDPLVVGTFFLAVGRFALAAWEFIKDFMDQ
ncbi:hypothetical protein E9229_003954 [Paeniglutamicibacter cryotolerans]|uniref:Uncharacterized protein n=1 Tax=Paeniglutamicibacter cryotolerans TaxID=670079 RepID=A0A839R0A3_9MICC|nr:hypothetical protein [Paeniglutamicibacter cryotolerans]